MDAEAHLTGEDAYNALSHRHQKFVDLVASGRTIFDAYRLAVYQGDKENPNRDSIHANGPRLLGNDRVREAVRWRCEQGVMSREEALARFADQARNLQMQYLRDDGTVDLPALIEDGYGHLVKETDYKGKDADRLVVRFHNAQTALDKILQAHGAYGAKGTVDSPNIHRVIFESVNAPPPSPNGSTPQDHLDSDGDEAPA